MKNVILNNGVYAAVALISINLLSLFFIGTDSSNYGLGEIVGYTAIVLSLGFVILGIRHYNMLNDDTSFIKNMAIGSGITLFPSLWFGTYNVIYIKWIDPNFMENYTNYSLDKMKATMSAQQFDEAKVKMIEDMEPFNYLYFQFIVMFMTVFIIGLIITVISSMILKFKPIAR
ncbi:MAG TPA: DUF4199 domain-containing protein [Fulvivirga sp.]|nr:DUF4199 domain-containing protein [Fulvivirga sp.]